MAIIFVLGKTNKIFTKNNTMKTRFFLSAAALLYFSAINAHRLQSWQKQQQQVYLLSKKKLIL
jgi:hypothetical protein